MTDGIEKDIQDVTKDSHSGHEWIAELISELEGADFEKAVIAMRQAQLNVTGCYELPKTHLEPDFCKEADR